MWKIGLSLIITFNVSSVFIVIAKSDNIEQFHVVTITEVISRLQRQAHSASDTMRY